MKNFLLLLLVSLISGSTFAQAVAWELSAQPGDQSSNLATFQAPNFDNCNLTRGAGVTATTGAGSMNASGWFSGATPTTLADAVAGNDYYEFTLNTINCLYFNPTTIKIVLRSSATGPNTATLRCSSDGFTTNIGTVSVTTTSTAYTFSETVSPNSSNVTYRLYGYGAAAGGGTPSSGGTMRIGSSTVASDNDLEVFASSTLLQVTTVSNITVTDGDAVPITAFTANVPGATFDWVRTPENIGLIPTSGSGNVPAFTATNPGSSTITSTFTVNATLGACESVDMVFTITVNPGACDITAVNFSNQSSCNDNGTPGNPGDDFFTADVTIQFVNPPSTGNLQIEPGGDAIGTYSIPVANLIGNSHTFTGVMLKANGTQTIIETEFTIPANQCTQTSVGPTVNSCSNAICDITSVTFANQGPCNDNNTPNNPGDDFFTADIIIQFINPPATGSLQIEPGGDAIGINSVPVANLIGNTHTFTTVQLKADGTQTIVEVEFTVPPNGCVQTQVGPTVNACSNGSTSCEVIGFSFSNISACFDNGTPNDDSDDFFQVNVDVLYSNQTPGATLTILGPSVTCNSGPQPALVGTNVTSTLPACLLANGQPAVFFVDIKLNGNVLCTGPGTGPAVNSCSSGGGACAMTDMELVSIEPCDDNGTPNDPTDDFYIADIKIYFENPPATGHLSVFGADLVDGDRLFNIANVLSNGSPFAVPNTKFRADGQTTSVSANFTDAPSCTISLGSAGVEPCSYPAPVLTCPASVTVSCASQVPPLDPTNVSETHTCPGNVTIVGVFPEFIHSQTCTNKFVITRAYNATDECGNVAQCSQFITVSDQTEPTMTCPPNTTVSCTSNVPPANITAVTNVADNCGGVVEVLNFPADVISNQTCPNRFTIQRSYFAVDVCGNSNNCIQTITVDDQTKPTITCPVNVTVSCANNVPPTNIASVTGVGDNCGGTVSIFPQGDNISNQTCPNRFTILRTYFAVDACNNSNNCIQTITVNDQTGPSITCPAPQTVSCAEQVPAPNPALVTGSDNCGGAITPSFFSNTISNQTCANRFTITRQYRASDLCGNTSSCTQIITVNDQTPPVFTSVPPNVTVDCYIVPAVGIATASDNCTSGATVVFVGETSVSGICPVFKILTRTWRATDACGNTATATQVITVTDTHAPQFLVLPKDQIVECGPDNANDFQAFIGIFGGALVEDCATITYTTEDSPFQSNYFDCGNTFHKNIRFIATDECGNSSFHDASFTVVDQTPPVFSTPPAEVNLECDETTDYGESAYYDWLDHNGYLVVEDNCGVVELEKLLVHEGSGCGNTWNKTYEFRAKDECGNITKTTATFAVVDHTPPTLVCPPNDNTLLSCIDDVPLADPTALSASDCSGVTLTHQGTWTNGTGCPGWMMTVAYRYAATDACGNVALCERAYYVEETETPTLICPDTIYVDCVNDIPGPVQLFGYVQAHLSGNCSGGFTSIQVSADSGQPQSGGTTRTYAFTAKNLCGELTSICALTFKANGNCNQLCTASQASWGDPNGTIGNMSTADALQVLLDEYGPLTVGGGNHTITATTTACVQEMLFGSGNCNFLPTGQFSCPLPAALANADGSLNNQLAANTMALQLNIWYNLEFNQRNLGIQDLHNLPPCLVEFELLKDLGQNSTVQDILNLSNQYLQGFVGYYSPNLPALLNSAIDNLNHFRVDCELNAPCERPGHGRSSRPLTDHTPPRVFPNPSSANAVLEYWAVQSGAATLKISAVNGKTWERSLQLLEGYNQVALFLEDLPAGIYGLTLVASNRLDTLQVVKID